MAGNDTGYLASFPAKKTLSKDSELFDSYLEFHFGLLLDLMRTTYSHTAISLDTDKCYKSRYTPDFIVQRNPKGLPIIDSFDVKGKAFKDDADAHKAAQLMIDVLGTEEYGVLNRSFSLIYNYDIRYYDEETKDIFKPKKAHYYLCPKCGKFEILPESNHRCSYCGTESQVFVENNKWEKFVQQHADTNNLPHRTANEMKWKRGIAALAKKANIALLPDSEAYQIEYPDRIDVMWNPDFAYELQPDTIPTYGSVSKLQGFISCIENSEDYKTMIRFLCNNAANKESIIRQAVFATKNGLYAAEWNNPKLMPASAYTCGKCGKGYFSADNDTKCPFCMSEGHAHKVTRKNNEN